MTGIVHRGVGLLGMANDATTIMADDDGGCTDYGTDTQASAVNWSAANGAKIISFSVCSNIGAQIGDVDMFLDYKAAHSPYLLSATASGNDQYVITCNKNRNGLTVGGGVESPGSSTRSLVQMDTTSYWNGSGTYTGQEKPNVVAISQLVSTAGSAWGATEVTGGSSAATPQVAGIVASIYEFNTGIQSWPEVVVPGMMVSADEDVDGTILNLNDSIDDKDGAGLVNAWTAVGVLNPSNKVNGGNAAIRMGHDYGVLPSTRKRRNLNSPVERDPTELGKRRVWRDQVSGWSSFFFFERRALADCSASRAL